MLVFEEIRCIPWAHNWCWRFARDALKSGSNHENTRTSKRPGTLLIPASLRRIFPHWLFPPLHRTTRSGNGHWNASILAHYNPCLPLTLAGDAFAYGVGPVISHRFPDSTEKPTVFVSCSLPPSVWNDSQLRKKLCFSSLELRSSICSCKVESFFLLPHLTSHF